MEAIDDPEGLTDSSCKLNAGIIGRALDMVCW